MELEPYVHPERAFHPVRELPFIKVAPFRLVADRPTDQTTSLYR